MVLILYAEHFSQPCRAVMAFCYQSKIPFDLKEVRLSKFHQKSIEFLSLFPLGTVPAITHEDISLVESHAILTYLAQAFNCDDQWYPKDIKKRAYIDEYLHWHHSNIRIGLGSFLYNKYLGPKYYGTKFSQEIDDSSLIKREKTLGYLDKVLEKSFVGKTDRPSVADLSCYCEFSQMKIVDYDFSQWGNVVKWMKEMETLYGIQMAHKVFYKLLPLTSAKFLGDGNTKK
ncbi:hypothetical protein SteCoe_29559 [Stentor coeruleus]|uniref:GST N-terminal domain-containing protein n=1 Tax=Stentor coeruleus TaxID=5963 RepID=A0A1R2B5P3_9CILI|nr:hypothetical protein SteCoe_29559 [Stentor coeruleus]